MSTEEVIETNTEEVIQEPEAVAAAESTTESGAGSTQEQGEEEVVVSIGEAQPPADEEARAPEWVRELRRKQRETVKELKEARAKIEALTAGNTPSELGAKPTLEDCDYDADRYESQLVDWYERKRKADEAKAKAEQAEREQSTAWQAKLEGYGKAKAELKFKDFEEAEAEASEILSSTQQAIIVKGSKNPALLIYALGKDTKEAKELAAISDPVEFAWTAATMEALKLKVTTKKNTLPPPERVLEGNGRVSGTVDSNLARLEAEADKTGDRSKVVAYKAQLRNKTK